MLRKVLLLKVCELIENTFPTIGKVTVLRVVRSTTRIPECESMKELSVVELSLVEGRGAS